MTNRDNTDNDWLTITEAAKVTGYHRQRIYELVLSGDVESRRRSSGHQVYMPSLYEYMQESDLRGPQPKRKGKDEQG